ncbi:MAG: SAM-dependent chlorinase/fluorinase, partial [Bacteroidota bacterium]|nr:SAM-dependent chlorinase/fluorinase [Bacteroidota bacterium]
MIITLTTDMGISDFYVASIKGSILKELPEVNIIDISHVIRPFDILHASFVIKNCFKDFPKGTIHIIGINPEK